MLSGAAAAPPSAGRGISLLVTAELPPQVYARTDALRRAHYPPGRIRLGAHVTLFHALPPSAEGAVLALLDGLCRRPPPAACITGIMDLGSGTAFAVDSPEMAAIHAEMAERLHGLIQQKDDRPLRLHITVQNKVATAEARALQARLRAEFRAENFHFRGFGLYGWTGDLWCQQRIIPFRGQK